MAPREVVLGNAPAQVLNTVVTWGASRHDVAVRRDGTTAAFGPDCLLVTDSTRRAQEATDAGSAALMTSGAEGPTLRTGWTIVTLPDDVSLHRPAAPKRAPATAYPADGRRPWPAVAIVIPIHDAGPELARCLEAVARHTTWPAELVLVDDASDEPEINRLIGTALDGALPVRRLRSSVNRGYTATVNRGLRATTGDVVVLNSDTEVGPRWLERLHDAAYRDLRTASATAVGDNAGAFSVPVIGRRNPIPLHLDLESAAHLAGQAVGDELVPTPTANGFCMYLRRAMLDDVGFLDEETFPRGYGEENDLSMRARAAGWEHVVDPGTFVHHVRESSFGSEKAQLSSAGRVALDGRHPSYTAEVATFVADPAMGRARKRIATSYREGQFALPRVLFVVHEGGGGTPLANFELMRGLEDRVDCLLFTSDRRHLRLDRIVGDKRIPIGAWDLDRRIGVLDFTRDDYRRAMEHCLREHAVDLVHIRHLFKHSFDAPAAAAKLGIPCVVSFHDFYFVCPTVNLLDDHDHYCAGRCTPGFGSCRIPPAGLEGLPSLKHAFVYQWQEEVATMLGGVDAFVTTSEHVRVVHRDALPSIADRPFHIIPHGRRLTQVHGLAVAPQPGGRVRIAVPGNLDVHKGADYLREIKRADLDDRLEFHFLGDVPERYLDLGVIHGRYAADELPSLIGAIKPAMIGLFSICAETFSHAMTEAWAMGVPVVATDLGAFGERLRQHEGGWLVPVDDPDEVVRRIVAVADEPDAYATQAGRADLRGCDSVAEMTDGYVALYAEVMDARRTLAPILRNGGVPRVARGTRRVTAVVPGAHGVHPGSTYVRVVQPLRHPRVARRLPSRIRYAADGTIPSDAELLIVQRTAIPPGEVPMLLSELERRRLPMVLDLDDHLLLKGDLDFHYGPHQNSLRELLAAAALVTVSTSKLKEAIQGHTASVALVPNGLDERLFLTGVGSPPDAGARAPDEAVHLVYMGSPTHAQDLVLLQGVIESLRRSAVRFTLDVVGVVDSTNDAPWFHRVTIPDRCKPYPRFVAWLRAQRPRWDIGLAPLVDSHFNSFKSDLKWLEYTALGLPVVASRVAPYETIVDGTTGRLASGTDEWRSALLELALEPERTRNMVHAAWQEVTSTRLLQHGADHIIDLLLSVGRDPHA